MAVSPEKLESLQFDIDLRLAQLWGEVDSECEWTDELVGTFIRAAYGKGYCDALAEKERGKLCAEYGYAIPAP